ncbi:MAG: MBL fold metallo-hydrolase [Bacteriovoracaceae bacterium]
MKITFLGASNTVTGSKTLLELGNQKVLVDCGMYQGKDSKDLNQKKLGFDPKELSAVFLTHGHFDHCGYLPVLVKRGFKGRIISSRPTREIVQIILEDSANIQEYESRKEGGREALYDALDVQRTIELFAPKDLGTTYDEKSYSYRFYEAGHILGAASVVFEFEGEKICFSGDLGRKEDLIHLAPDFPKEMDYLVLESTYGDRAHPKTDYLKEFEKHIVRVRQTKGVLLIPSFAVARSQVVLHILAKLFQSQRDLRVPVYFDSPMGNRATRLYAENCHLLKVSKKEFEDDLAQVQFMDFRKDLKRLTKAKGPYILISSSGMISGGRILKHFDMLAKHEKNTILLVGYQGEGTIGRALLENQKEVVLFGHTVNIRAQVDLVESLSAHADRDEMINLIDTCVRPPKKIFLNHGEEQALKNFQKTLAQKFPSEVEIAELDKTYEL